MVWASAWVIWRAWKRLGVCRVRTKGVGARIHAAESRIAIGDLHTDDRACGPWCGLRYRVVVLVSHLCSVALPVYICCLYSILTPSQSHAMSSRVNPTQRQLGCQADLGELERPAPAADRWHVQQRQCVLWSVRVRETVLVGRGVGRRAGPLPQASHRQTNKHNPKRIPCRTHTAICEHKHRRKYIPYATHDRYALIGAKSGHTLM